MCKVYELEVIYLKEPVPDYAKFAKSQVESWCPKFTSCVEEAIRTARNVVEDLEYYERKCLRSLKDRTTEIYGCDADGFAFKVLSANAARQVLEVRYKRHIK